MTSKTRPRVFAVKGIAVIFLLGLLVQHLNAESPSWPPRQPIPRLETGMHTGPIWRLSVDAQERFLVTASKDKTARVWDLAGGNLKLLQILRVPIGDAPFEGQLFGAAVSPDGKEVAAAGYTGGKNLHNFTIYIFDLASGRIKHTIPDLPVEISYLTFSPDGRFLAVTLVGAQGLRIYSSHDWSEIYRDKESYTYDSYWADFDPQNRLVTTSYDGYLRLYKLHEEKFKLSLKIPVRKGFKPSTARFSPDGSLLAVGSQVAATRPASDFTPRLVPYFPGVAVPLEIPLILWHH